MLQGKFKFAAILNFYIITLLAFNCGAIAKVTAPFAGTFGAKLLYTPENEFEAGYYLALRNKFAKRDSKINANLSIFCNQPREDRVNFPFTNSSLNLPFYVSQIRITNRVPLWKNAGEERLTIGTVSINYSPYTVSLSGVQSRKGLGFDGFYIGKTSFNGFVVWPEKINLPLYGVKAERNLSKGTITLINARYVNHKSNGTKDLEEMVGSIELKLKHHSGTLTFLHAGYEKGNNVKNINLCDFTTRSDSVFLRLIWRDFETGYKPLFYQKTELFRSYTGEYRGWNPVDEFAGWKGLTLSLDTKVNGLKINYLNHIYKDRDHFKDNSLKPAIINHEIATFKGRFYGLDTNLRVSRQISNFETESGVNKTETGTSMLAWVTKRITFPLAKLSLSARMWKDDGTELLDNNGERSGIINEKGSEVFAFVDNIGGVFENIRFVGGIRNISTDDKSAVTYWQWGLDHQISNDLDLVIRITRPNFVEPKHYYLPFPGGRERFDEDQYNRFGERVQLDNIIQLRYCTNF